MFFGFFSSITPYIVAGGFYIIFLLLSFVQPLLSKFIAIEKEIQTKNAVYYSSPAESAAEDVYNYDNSSIKDDSSLNNEAYSFYEIYVDVVDSINIKYSFFYKKHDSYRTASVLTELFFRPPPFC